MMSKLLVCAGLGVLCLNSAVAKDFNFTFTADDGFSGDLFLQGTDGGNGIFTIDSGWFQATGSDVVFNLAPDSDLTGDSESYDNELFMQADEGYLDGYGLKFENGDDVVNIWNGDRLSTDTPTGHLYTYSMTQGGSDDGVLAPRTPGPIAALPFALGLLRRRRRSPGSSN